MSILTNLFIKKISDLIPGPTEEDRNVENYLYKNKIRSCEVECLYAEVRYNFKIQIQNRELNRGMILCIREYLESNVKVPEKKIYKNDCHSIYDHLKSKYITIDNLNYVKKLLKPYK